MNYHLQDFIDKNFKHTGSALDLGAGNFSDVNYLKKLGWQCEGVDLITGIDLENPYHSSKAPFDLVFSNFVIHKLKNRTQFLKTAIANLKEEGKFFLQTLDSSDKISKSGINKDWLVKEMASVGFKNIESAIFDFYDDDEGHKHWHRILQATAIK